MSEDNSREDLGRQPKESAAPMGLLAAVGAWADFEKLDQLIEDIYQQREQTQNRPVMLES